MGTDDKLSNKGQEIKGRAKEEAGRVRGEPGMEAEGRTDRSKANLKQAGEKIKDALRGLTGDR